MPTELLGEIDFSLSAILSSLVFGVIGMWMFKEGKKKGNFHIIFIAMGLMIYPYFTKGPLQDWGLGVLLCGLAYNIWV